MFSERTLLAIKAIRRLQKYKSIRDGGEAPTGSIPGHVSQQVAVCDPEAGRSTSPSDLSVVVNDESIACEVRGSTPASSQ